MNVIEQRKKVYGDFEYIAKISQELKNIMFNAYDNSDAVSREALDMILHKLARIAGSKDGWKVIDNVTDIAGYAKLWEKHLENLSGSIKTLVTYEKNP